MKSKLLFVFLLVFSISAHAVDLKDHHLDQIAAQSTAKITQFKVWDTQETFAFTEVFPCKEPCNQVGWPAVFAKYKKPIRWIQIVRFNKPGLGNDVKENLPNRLLKYSFDEWTFLDGTNVSAPYLYEEETDRVYDNPKATYAGTWGKDEPLVWEAFLFGIENDKQNNTIKPIFGVYWGYSLPKNGKPTPLKSKDLSRKAFKNLVKQYDIDSFISQSHGLKIIY